MRNPIQRNADLYKGATFDLKFRLKDHCGKTLDPGEVYFTLSTEPDGDEVLSYTTSSSPTKITIDTTKDYLVTIELTPTDTAAIAQQGELYMEIDTLDEAGKRRRRWIGDITLHEQAVDAD